MSLAHVHLALNHVPVMGVLFAGVLLAIGVVRANPPLQRLALGFLLAFALTAVPVYLTGQSAEHLAERLPGVSEAAIDRHEDAARLSLIAVEVLGAGALLGLAAFRRASIPRAFALGLLGLTLATTGLFGWTGYVGGEIRHPEIRAAGGPTPAETAVQRAARDDDD